MLMSFKQWEELGFVDSTNAARMLGYAPGSNVPSMLEKAGVLHCEDPGQGKRKHRYYKKTDIESLAEKRKKDAREKTPVAGSDNFGVFRQTFRAEMAKIGELELRIRDTESDGETRQQQLQAAIIDIVSRIEALEEFKDKF